MFGKTSAILEIVKLVHLLTAYNIYKYLIKIYKNLYFLQYFHLKLKQLYLIKIS